MYVVNFGINCYFSNIAICAINRLSKLVNFYHDLKDIQLSKDEIEELGLSI